MFLDVANRQRIDEPTSKQIAFHLRNLPADAPFMILNADDEHFIQATTAANGQFRVEWRQESQQRFMVVPLERAEKSFQAFRGWDEQALRALPWRRLGRFNDPYGRIAIIVLALFLLAIALMRLWSALR